MKVSENEAISTTLMRCLSATTWVMEGTPQCPICVKIVVANRMPNPRRSKMGSGAMYGGRPGLWAPSAGTRNRAAATDTIMTPMHAYPSTLRNTYAQQKALDNQACDGETGGISVNRRKVSISPRHSASHIPHFRRKWSPPIVTSLKSCSSPLQERKNREKVSSLLLSEKMASQRPGTLRPQLAPEPDSPGNCQPEAEQHTTPNDKHKKNVETFLKQDIFLMKIKNKDRTVQ